MRAQLIYSQTSTTTKRIPLIRLHPTANINVHSRFTRKHPGSGRNQPIQQQITRSGPSDVRRQTLKRRTCKEMNRRRGVGADQTDSGANQATCGRQEGAQGLLPRRWRRRRRRARGRAAEGARGDYASEDEKRKWGGANGHFAAVTLAHARGFAPCTSGPPSGQNGPTHVDRRRLHSGKHSVGVFPRMQAAAPILHSPSLFISLCNPPNNHGLHCTSLGRPYTAYQTVPKLLGKG
jgi:hypothetical protein